MKENYVVSNVTKICTTIALIFDGISVITLTFLIVYFQKLFDLIIEDLNMYPSNVKNQIMEYQDLFRGLVIIGTILSSIFLVINLILFIKLINKKVSLKAAKRITIYQIIYGVISISGNSISAILYLISGISSNTNLRPVITDSVVEEF